MSAFDEIKVLIDEQKSFVLEAGAGSGKTYTLIQTINHVLQQRSDELKFNNQKIVCITYTNVAKNEIIERLENNPLVIVSTIHEFLWDSIKRFNKQLVLELDRLNTIMCAEKPDKFSPRLIERIREVRYEDSSFRDFESGQIEHDDVITLSNFMMKEYPLLTDILSSKYPYIFVDEYQDTAAETVEALINFLTERNRKKILIGFFGDSYQKIYDSGIGSLETYITAKKINLVSKEENYRSSENVIKLLNNVRTNIQQKIPDDKTRIAGSVKFINCTNYPEKERKEGVRDYNNRIAPQKTDNYQSLLSELESQGWNFNEKSEDKILIIANSRVAERGGFGNLYGVFSNRFGQGANDQLLKRENAFVSFFLGSVDKKTSLEREAGIEHLVRFYKNEEYSKVMKFLGKTGSGGFNLKKHADKEVIKKKIDELVNLRDSGKVKEVFDFILENKLMHLNRPMARFLENLEVVIEEITDEELRSKAQRNKTFFDSLMDLPYVQLIKLFRHTQHETVFSTKHGTKGEEYRNVLVVIDDTSWVQQYNFQNFINSTESNPDRALRTKNLFYVSCSRAIEKLVVLSLSTMDDAAMSVIHEWFESKNVTTI
jgi:DNA helicase-2/ATP-dependent DNA helicase PcrA